MIAQIRKGRIEDVDAIKAIADANRRELGFIMRPTLTKSVQNQSVLVATDDSRVLGFVEYHHRRDDQTTIYHIVVEQTHRGIGLGRQLFIALVRESIRMDKKHIQLKCPAELDANEFYRKVNCQLSYTEKGKERYLNVWRYLL